MLQAFLRFANNEDGGPLVQVARFVVGVMVLAAWGLGVRFILSRCGASEHFQSCAVVFGMIPLALLEILIRAAARNWRAITKGIQTMPVCPESPPCDAARYGAVFLTYAIYVAWFCGGLPLWIGLAMQGDGPGILWAVAAVLGLAGVATGIGAALTHDDPVRPDSLLWSVGVVGLGAYALLHQWVLTDTAYDYHLTRALWLGWMAGNGVNIVLNLRGIIFRRRERAAGDGQIRTIPDSSRRLRRRRRVSTEWVEEIEGHGIEDLHRALLMGNSSIHLPPRVSPDLIEHDGSAPQIVYVKRGNAFIPVLLDDAGDDVPVNRRLS